MSKTISELKKFHGTSFSRLCFLQSPSLPDKSRRSLKIRLLQRNLYYPPHLAKLSLKDLFLSRPNYFSVFWVVFFLGFILFFFCHGLFGISFLTSLFESETTQIRGFLVLFGTARGHPINSIIIKATVFGRLRTTEVVSMHPESFKTSSTALDIRCSNFLDQGQSETQDIRNHEQESL